MANAKIRRIVNALEISATLVELVLAILLLRRAAAPGAENENECFSLNFFICS